MPNVPYYLIKLQVFLGNQNSCTDERRSSLLPSRVGRYLQWFIS